MIHWIWLLVAFTIGLLIGAGMMRYDYSQELRALLDKIKLMGAEVEKLKGEVEAKKK